MAELSIAELGGRLDIEGLHPLTGGASSLTYAGRLAGEQVVVKVAPAGVEPIGHRDVLRQCRIIKALAPTPVPVPRVLLEDPGDPPEVPPLFVMSRVEGTSVEPLFDLDGRGVSDRLITDRFRHAAEIMTQLHRIRPADIGLAAEPVIGPEAEIDRWCRTLETVDPALAPGWPDVRDALRAALPAPLRPTLIHGDFRLGNLLAVGDRITAVIDWEIWSVGDPRVDVGWFLINSDPQTYRRATRDVGVTPAELAAVYQSALGYSVPDLDWFQALACFKSVATWALIVKHNRRRPRPDAELEAMSKTLPHLLSRARELLG